MNFRPEHDPQRIVIAPGVTPKSGTVAHVIKWCRDTRHRRSTFTTEMARSGCSELVSWAANGSQGMNMVQRPSGAAQACYRGFPGAEDGGKGLW